MSYVEVNIFSLKKYLIKKIFNNYIQNKKFGIIDNEVVVILKV